MFPSLPVRPVDAARPAHGRARGARPRPGRLHRQRRPVAGADQLRPRRRDRRADRHAAPDAEPDARPGLPGDPDRRRGHRRHARGRAAEDRVADAGRDRDPVRARRRRRESSPATDIRRLPAEAAVALPDVATFTAVDVEKIVGLGADLVIAGGNCVQPARGDHPAARPRRPGPRRLRRRRSTGVLNDIELIGDARSAAATRPTRPDRHDAGRLRRRRRPPRPACPSRGPSTRSTPRPAPIYTVADDSVLRRDDHAGRRRRRSRPGARPTTRSRSRSSIAADPEVILLGDAAYGVDAGARSRPGRAGRS